MLALGITDPGDHLLVSIAEGYSSFKTFFHNFWMMYMGILAVYISMLNYQ